MAGIFSIFSESENSNSLSINKGKEKSQTLAFSKLKTFGNTASTPAKKFAQPQPQSKPKGLSIRSKSDLNVSVFNNPVLTKPISKDCMNLEDKPCTSKKQILSPLKMKTPKSKSSANIITKKLSPKISSPIMQNVVDEFVFRKPATPKQSKKYPEPETLAYDFDAVKFMNDEIESIFNEERMSMRNARNDNDSVSSMEDEGFISDPEFDSFQAAHEISLSSLSDIELPEISDCED